MGAGIKLNIPKPTPKVIFQLLVIAYWSHWTILRYIVTFLKGLPIIEYFGSLIMPVTFIALIVFSLPYILQRVRITDFLLYLFIVLIILSTLLFYPDSKEYIFPYLWQILGTSAPLFFLGVAYDHEDSKKALFWCSLIGVITTFLYQIYKLASGRILETDNMSASYSLLPSIMYLIYWAIDNKGVKYVIIAVMGSLVSFIFGTRGPILIISLSLAICLVYKTLKLKNIILKILTIILIISITIYVNSGDRILQWAMELSEKFGEMGFSTRIFDFIIDEDLANDTGRDDLSETVWKAILEKPFSGYGFMGDRQFVDVYVHNIVLEFLCSYGFVFGTAGIAAILCTVVAAIIKSKGSSVSWLLFILACFVLIKLMLSGSYVFEPYFYLFMGMCVGVVRRSEQSKLTSH